MSFKLKHRFHKITKVEHTYFETDIPVREGVAECKTEMARDALMYRGYELIDESAPKPKSTPKKKKETGDAPKKKSKKKTTETTEPKDE